MLIILLVDMALCVAAVMSPSHPSFVTKPHQNTTILNRDQIIYTTNHNITKILVPSEGSNTKYTNEYSEKSYMPTIFFTVSDDKMEGKSCIYVLEDLTAYEVLEGGRDTTSDYVKDNEIYFGGKDGIYKYNPDTLSAKKYGPFRDNIVQLQKANGKDSIYFLTDDNVLYKIENNGTIRTRITAAGCITEFVLDTSNNIYYINCNHKLPHVILNNGLPLAMHATLLNEFREIQLLRPAFFMEASVPLVADGEVYILHANGTTVLKEIALKVLPSAISIDAGLYVVYAVGGDIYEFNVLDALVQSMFGLPSDWTKDLTSIVGKVMDSLKI